MQVDRSINNKSTAENANKLVPYKDGAGESTSLKNFRDTIKDVLEEITSLEINTLIVSSIPIAKFDAKEFYLELIEKIMYRTEEGLGEVKESLLERSAQLKQKGLSLPQQTTTPLLPKEALVIQEYRAELTRYNYDLESYKEQERFFNDRRNCLNQAEKEQFALEEACYEQLAKQVSKMEIQKDANGKLIVDAQIIRCLRKAWEFEQSVLNGDHIYAQTKFHLDGDLTNRFINDLFIPTKSKIDPKMAQLVFDVHRQGVENAQKQWSGLIMTCVNLVKDLMPFRAK